MCVQGKETSDLQKFHMAVCRLSYWSCSALKVWHSGNWISSLDGGTSLRQLDGISDEWICPALMPHGDMQSPYLARLTEALASQRGTAALRSGQDFLVANPLLYCTFTSRSQEAFYTHISYLPVLYVEATIARSIPIETNSSRPPPCRVTAPLPSPVR